jgi:hypothetical protein
MQNPLIKDMVDQSLFSDEQKLHIANLLARIRKQRKQPFDSNDYFQFKSSLENAVLHINSSLSDSMTDPKIDFLVKSINTIFLNIDETNYRKYESSILSILSLFAK